jgi:acetyl esterase
MAIIDPDLQTMLEAQAKAMEGQQMPPLDLLPAEMVRAGYRVQRLAQDTRAPKDVAAQDLKVPGDAGDVGCRLYTPAGAAAVTPGLVYFHGGGFVIGDLDTHDGHCRRLASYAGVRVLSVDYRLAPEHPFPASHDDALAVTKWAFDHAEGIGFDPARIAVGGDSAGGNLAASVALDLRGDPKRKVAFQLLLYPGIWPEEETQTRKDRDGPLLTREALAWFEKHLAVGEHPDRHRAGLGYVKDLSGAPPALVVTAGHDPLEDEGKDFAARLNAAGVAAEVLHYDDLIHDFYTLGDVSPRVEEASRETAAKLKAGLA